MRSLMRRAVLGAFRVLPGGLTKWAVFWLKRKYVIGVVAVVADERGRFLFLHHTYRKKRAWRLPGGLKERHEDVFVTACRELKEEANLTVQALQVIAVEPAEVTMDIAVLCEVKATGPFIVNDEIDDLAWLDPEEATFEIPPEQLRFIAVARQVLLARGHGATLPSR